MSEFTNRNGRELLEALERDLHSAAVQTDLRAEALVDAARRCQERWEAWHSQWKQGFKAVNDRQRERMDYQLRTAGEMEAAEAEFGKMEAALHECVETATALAR